ncbi:MAG TPA: hypothetical protein VGQ99_15395 [Tepidisphaeraceae bacterium]|nr:hypothetical protein [Tepidisphaeraceae bacterium]
MSVPSIDQPEPRPALLTPTYAPPARATPWHRRRRFRIGSAVAFAIIAALGALYFWRAVPKLWQLSRLQRKCLAYTAPPDQVVYSEVPGDVATLPATSPQYSLIPSSNPPAVTLVPTCWTDFPLWRTARGCAVVFLGERATGQGQKRLVCVIFTGWGGSPVSSFPGAPATGTPTFDLISFSIGTLQIPPQSNYWPSDRVVYSNTVPRSLHLRFFAGQPDPANQSRFTIPYELNGQRGTIEGRLGRRDNDFFLRIIDGPLKDIYPSP